VTLPDDLASMLEREARRRSTSVSGVVRDALSAHFGVGRTEPRDLPFAGLGDSGHTDTAERAEEVLAEIFERRARDR
jgi:hypothetical protein